MTRGTAIELHMRVLLEATPAVQAHNSAVLPHPAAYNGSVLRLRTWAEQVGSGLSFKSNTSATGFHWETVKL